MSLVFDTFNGSYLRSPARIVTPRNASSIHRFFDSSPFSPTGRLLAYSQLSDGLGNYGISGSAIVSVVDLFNGSIIYQDNSNAWGSQVGAHVQWGRTDRELVYNKMYNQVINQPHDNPKLRECPMLANDTDAPACGVKVDTTTGITKILQCPIYHVNAFGTYAVSPNLYKIKYAQQGYGIQSESTENTHAVDADGIYLTDMRTGQCKLFVSLYQLATYASIDTTNTPMYSFHTKWSSDGKMVMVVARTLETSRKSKFMQRKSTRGTRVQHLFVVTFAEDSDTPSIQYVLSWASKAFIPADSSIYYQLQDGNHPNWIPNTTSISMNLRVGEGLNPSAFIYPGTAQNYWYSTNFKKSEAYKLVVIDISRVKGTIREDGWIKVLYGWGTGHPNFLSGGRFVIMDSYMKQKKVVEKILQEKEQSHKYSEPNSTPLRLIDTWTRKEVVLAQVIFNLSSKFLGVIHFFGVLNLDTYCK